MIFFSFHINFHEHGKSSTEALITRLAITDYASAGCSSWKTCHCVAYFRYGNYLLWVWLSHRRICQHLNFCFTHSTSSRTVIKKKNFNPTLRNPLESLLLRNSILEAARSSNQLIYQSWSCSLSAPPIPARVTIILMGQTTNLRISKKICITTLCKIVNGWWWSGQRFDAASNTFLHIFRVLRFCGFSEPGVNGGMWFTSLLHARQACSHFLPLLACKQGKLSLWQSS